jgi:hypothetical protein
VALRFVADEASRHVPNVVVDGSPNEGTVLTLSHWPGIPAPAGMAADLSAEMALRYVRAGHDPGADVVTNNHFDQDGLVGVIAFVDPEAALAHEDLLRDLAAAGDFATYRDRRAARASMAIEAFASADRSPIADRLTSPYDEQCAILYEALLPLVVEMVLDPEPYRDLWAEEDERLTATERALASGAIAIEERPELDLAIVRIGEREPDRPGHRFAHDRAGGAHPMAVHNRTGRFRLLDVHGRRFTYADRYETWVQYRSRRPLPRVDLRPLAARLTAEERDGGTWTADAPSTLTPALRSPDESTLDESIVLRLLADHLVAAPPAWDPYVVS